MLSKFIPIFAVFIIVKSAKILVIVPAPIKSHQVMFRPLVQELISRDHEVTVITTDPIYPQGGAPNNLKEIDVHDLSYMLFLKVGTEMSNIDKSDFNKMKDGYRVVLNIFKEQLKHKSVQKLLTDATIKFDLLIVTPLVQAALIFSHIFNTPVISMSPFGPIFDHMKIVGSGAHPLLYPTHYHKKIYNLTIWEKIYALYTNLAYDNMHEMQELEDDKMLKDIFGIDTPILNELKNNVDIFFLNVNPIWLHNPPASPSNLYTWGFHKPLEKLLPQELQTYLDSSKHGVIYISFGSYLKTSEFPPEILLVFLKVFSRLPYDILWKWDADELPGKSENIKISKWFPQWDILRHPNLKLFITHGGLKSINEAIDAGVPVIGIPQFSDQEYNTEKIIYFKIGIKLHYKSITVEKLEKAITSIITEYNTYKNNVIRLQTQMHDQPKPALEHVTWWIEYVLRHGGVRHLRAPAANMSWVQYYELELVLLVLTGLIAIGTVLLVIVYSCILRL